MNLKKILISLITLVVFWGFVFSQNIVQAETPTKSLFLKATALMSYNKDYNDEYLGYAIGGASNTIWNIVTYTSATSNDPTESTKSNVGTIYCAKAGQGMGFANPTNPPEEYNVYYNMKTEKNSIRQQNEVFASIVDGGHYNEILALLDMFYFNGKSSEEDKTALTDKVMEEYDGTKIYLNEDDIKAVQQAALWYFTNYGDSNYDKIQGSGWLQYTLDGQSYSSLSGYNPTNVTPNNSIGSKKQEQAEILYQYLINTAKANASKYENLSEYLEEPAKVNTSNLNYEESGSNYIVGPINIIEQESNNISYTIDYEIKNGNSDIFESCNFLKEDKSNANTTNMKDLVGEKFYISIPKSSVEIENLKIGITINYNNTKLLLWGSTGNGGAQPVVTTEKEQKSIPYTLTTNKKKVFDLALRKYITKIGDVELTGDNSRVPNIDESTLNIGTTAKYKHRKDPLTVKTGDIVTYKITIYNEGEKSGRATKVVDQLPTGLKFKEIVSGNFEKDSYDEATNTLKLKRESNNTDNLEPYEIDNMDSETIEITCIVTAMPDSENSKILTNVAWISEEYDAEDGKYITNEENLDRDSEPGAKPDVNKDNMSNYTGNGNKNDLNDSTYYYKGQQDDDDFEKLIIMPEKQEAFDLKLIKRIVAVNNQNVPERIESVDVSKLNTIDDNGKLVTTGDYKLNKNPVGVKKGDIVTYTFRIYNEGTIDGYASEITEDIPEGLQFIWSEKEGDELKADTTLTDEEKEAIEFNQKYLWTFKYDESGEKIKEITTNYLDMYGGAPAPEEGEDNRVPVTENLIKAFGENDGTKTEKDISYKEVSVKLKVVAENVSGEVIRNEACISEDTDEEGNPVDDRDSDTEDWVKYEDDEDYDNIILQSFDLALRKFIVAISDDTTIDEGEYLKNTDGSYTRAPVVDTSKLNTEDENGKLITTAIYNHTKEPILVKKNDIIIYMLRVYNEGEIDGYASEIKDHLPPYLEFVESEFNEEYGWTVSEDGRTVTTEYLKDSKIKKASKNSDEKIILAYKEVPIMCKVKDTAKSNEKITNIADITEYLDENKDIVTDRDSQPDNVVLPEDKDLPSYKDDESGDYIPGQQDDDDFEKVIVKEFDLALRKWVTQAIVIENGQQTVTNTGHDAWDDPEQVVKVELHRKKLNQVTVKFRYSIRVYNQGDVEGYAKEVTDYIPEGLKFVAEDNPGWTDEGNNVISTNLLENTLLKPGEYADIEVVLTWINNSENMGVKINTAEISKDYNKYNLPDKDSTPDNKKQGEDDIDDAPVMLSIVTGQLRIYFTLGFIVLITIAGGVLLIKKYVL